MKIWQFKTVIEDARDEIHFYKDGWEPIGAQFLEGKYLVFLRRLVDAPEVKSEKSKR